MRSYISEPLTILKIFQVDFYTGRDDKSINDLTAYGVLCDTSELALFNGTDFLFTCQIDGDKLIIYNNDCYCISSDLMDRILFNSAHAPLVVGELLKNMNYKFLAIVKSPKKLSDIRNNETVF